jgi:hypothetical protein
MLINGKELSIGPFADLIEANLSGAYLREANLREANLEGADLSEANLKGADLLRAYLSGADLSEANLSGAYLSEANFIGANLKGADLSGAYLSGADLSGADLSGAYLMGAYLIGANLKGAYLSFADLSGAYLREANLSGANLSEAYLMGAYLSGAKNISSLTAATLNICPEGDLIGYKKLRDQIICKLKIPASAKRSNAAGRKCRAEYAIVLEGEGYSIYNREFEYRIGETVCPTESFCEDRWTECASGIHFYLTPEEAKEHIG